jgi:hypothetical protein
MTFPNTFTIISDEVSQDLPAIRAFVRDFRLPGIELRSFAGRSFKDLTREDVATIGGAAREEGWKIFGCSTPVFREGHQRAPGYFQAKHRRCAFAELRSRARLHVSPAAKSAGAEAARTSEGAPARPR